MVIIDSDKGNARQSQNWFPTMPDTARKLTLNRLELETRLTCSLTYAGIMFLVTELFCYPVNCGEQIEKARNPEPLFLTTPLRL